MKKAKKKTINKKAPSDRPEILQGSTYKLKDVPNGIDGVASLFVTINDYKNNPYEIFIDVKCANLYEHLTVYTRLISMMLRSGTPIMEIVEELKQITSDSTGHYIPKRGIRVNSLAARIGVCLEDHCVG